MSSRPQKPYPHFPLFPHQNGQWAKKIRGKLVYFGPWADPDGALQRYLNQKDDLHAGKSPRTDPEGVTVKDVVNAFLNAKQSLLDAGELAAVTFDKYERVADEVIAHFGKQRCAADLRPADFADLREKLAKKWGPVRLGVSIQHIRSIFKHAFDTELLPTPVRFGPGFKGPTKKTLRLHRAGKGEQLFTAGEIRELLAAAGQPLKAMIFLGINCGLGNSDCGNLPLAALDLESGWLNYPRPKTGIARRCPLWPETVQAMQEAIAERTTPRDKTDAGLVFITKYGGPWVKDTPDSPISKEVRKLLNRLKIPGHRNFYTLRHTFRTVADEAKDQPAADAIMGHESGHMSSHYREKISDARLRAVSEHVRGWLWADRAAPPDAAPS